MPLGFRSTFETGWAIAPYPRDLAEKALAHVIENKTEGTYRRGDALERRREMMNSWAQFIAKKITKKGEEIANQSDA